MNPIVDECKDKFSWGLPNMDDLLQYALKNFDWSFSKTKSTMDPIFKKISERTVSALNKCLIDYLINFINDIKFYRHKER